MRSVSFLFALIAALGLAAGPAGAAGEAKPPKSVSWSFQGPFGTFDRAQLQRGFQVYREVCSSCHGVQYLAFRNLLALGYSEDQAKAIAAEYQVVDGPDEFGEMYERPGELSDYLPSPFPNEAAARAANNGAYPPDLSLVVKARMGGADYIYSVLTGYEDPPAGEELRIGLYYNPYFPGNKIAMPMPLFDGLVEYADGTEATVEQMGKDVTAFMAWIAEPQMENRKETGFAFMLFMIVLAVLLYLTNKRIWRPVKEGRVSLADKQSGS